MIAIPILAAILALPVWAVARGAYLYLKGEA